MSKGFRLGDHKTLDIDVQTKIHPSLATRREPKSIASSAPKPKLSEARPSSQSQNQRSKFPVRSEVADRSRLARSQAQGDRSSVTDRSRRSLVTDRSKTQVRSSDRSKTQVRSSDRSPSTDRSRAQGRSSVADRASDRRPSTDRSKVRSSDFDRRPTDHSKVRSSDFDRRPTDHSKTQVRPSAEDRSNDRRPGTDRSKVRSSDRSPGTDRSKASSDRSPVADRSSRQPVRLPDRDRSRVADRSSRQPVRLPDRERSRVADRPQARLANRSPAAVRSPVADRSQAREKARAQDRSFADRLRRSEARFPNKSEPRPGFRLSESAEGKSSPFSRSDQVEFEKPRSLKRTFAKPRRLSSENIRRSRPVIELPQVKRFTPVEQMGEPSAAAIESLKRLSGQNRIVLGWQELARSLLNRIGKPTDQESVAKLAHQLGPYFDRPFEDQELAVQEDPEYAESLLEQAKQEFGELGTEEIAEHLEMIG